MLTKLVIRNFKRFEDVEIPLSNPVVFVGPNNSGKTTALQALALWELGLRRWREKRGERGTPGKRPGVSINRRDLLMVPAPAANLLWRGLHVRNVQRANGKQDTQNIRIDVLVEGISDGSEWRCGLEFDFANDESFYCRPLRMGNGKNPQLTEIPEAAYSTEIAFLPPMSGLSSNETRLDVGAVNVRLGEGRTAEVLRNLCYQLCSRPESTGEWQVFQARVKDLFQVELEAPEYIAERGEIEMYYRESGMRLDLSSSGRGQQQTMLLLAYLALHPGSVLLLDEPDAHLEVVRQREIFTLLCEAAASKGSQLIIASHSEEVLNQAAAASAESVVAFLGKRPHRIPADRTTAIKRALDKVRYDQYYQAEQAGWVLYLEDRTDLEILRAFARRLNHAAQDPLRMPFVVAVGNQPNTGREHFNALLEAKPDLVGYLLVDRDAPGLQSRPGLKEKKWERQEIENYLCQPETLESFALEFGRGMEGGPLFEGAGAERAVEAMRKAIADWAVPAALRNREDAWWSDVKASDDFLDKVFPAFAAALGRRNEIRKADYHRLVAHIPEGMIADEVVAVLDGISATAAVARPAGSDEE